MTQTLFNEYNKPSAGERKAMTDFLHAHLEEFRDSKEDIDCAMAYILREIPSPGGFILRLTEDQAIVCVVMIAKTGMKGFVPENLVVYLATHREYRGRGIGRKMMQLAMDAAEGNLALHVEPHNPARKLYEDLGFTNKYLEMRCIRREN
ncbi:MAG TPA: GNAT family N-acetyltransferase [Bacteroidales bacterium]|jgi:ribosomal protein S18 acetylase RimI-like enzyme|nr:GNAT family N-acetyltransferase [Bacteroidales bacterium]MCZ2417163.1 GNAT family N-acetyltransferase [Burkholderiales bacterium]OQC58786.1 MAG: Acetyltransferase (GNAT) family protein [Bacteroidetes bacterium ADurb.Bin013]MBP8999090.1 GNAT family N-acetyltransferase [Bacteroidales bacterium]MBV6455846.1 hypothetical protein [Bacteroidales bacterium]